MKKITLLYCFLIFSTIVFGQTSKTVNVTTAGTLSTLITTSEAKTITTLTITGNIDARDVAFMRDKVLYLATLDLSSASIKAYTGIYGTYDITTIAYPANEMPLCSFYNATTFTYKGTLTTIKLPTTLTSIGGSAFYNCYGLTGTFTLPASVTYIGSYALYGCSLLSAFVVETANKRFSSNNGVLFNKNQDSLFICPSAKTGSFTIPQTVVSIGASAFESCYNLTGTLTIPSAVKSIGSYAFYHCTGFTGDITFPSSMVSIGDCAFSGCTGLSGTITIPKSLISLGYFVFFKCNNVKSYQVDLSNILYSSNNDALYSKNQDTLFICPGGKAGSFTIASTVKAIGSYAFYNCSKLTGSMVIPATVSYIGSYAFYGCNLLTSFVVDIQNIKYLSNNGVLFTKNQDTLIVFPIGKIGSYSIPNTVKCVATCALCNCTNISGSMFIPPSVSSIGEYAFYGLTQLTSFEVDPANAVYSSKDGLLLDYKQDSLYVCPPGKSGIYVIPNTVVYINKCAFDGCTGLTEITVPNSVNNIGEYAFEYCTGLIKIYLPPNLTTIGSGALYNCNKLQLISIANPTPPTIDYYTFYLVPQTSCQLIVPVGSSSSYLAATYWKNFTNINENSFPQSVSYLVNTVGVRVYALNEEIMIEGVQKDENIEVYSLVGKHIATLKSNGSKTTIQVQKGELYMIKTKSGTTKIAI